MELLSHPEFTYRFNPWACETCGGRCCTGESGYIWVTSVEMEKISHYLKLDFKDFVSAFVVQVDRKFSIKEVRDNGDNGMGYACIFFDSQKGGCTIYPVRPTQCRTFPFWDYFKDHKDEVMAECPGIVG